MYVRMNSQTGELTQPQNGDTSDRDVEVTYVAMFQKEILKKQENTLLKMQIQNNMKKYLEKCMKT